MVAHKDKNPVNHIQVVRIVDSTEARQDEAQGESSRTDRDPGPSRTQQQPAQQQQPSGYVPPMSMTPFTFRISGNQKSGDKRLRMDPTHQDLRR